MRTATRVDHAVARTGRRRPAMVFACCLSALTLTMCTNPFAPKLDEDSSGLTFITGQKTPADLFQNFAYAYTFRDSLLYAELLDSTFLFEYFDPNIGESGAFASWSRDVELKTTGRLLTAFETIELEWLRTIYESPEIDGELTVLRNFRLRLVGRELNVILQGAAILTLVRNPDGKLRIRHWVDESNL